MKAFFVLLVAPTVEDYKANVEEMINIFRKNKEVLDETRSLGLDLDAEDFKTVVVVNLASGVTGHAHTQVYQDRAGLQ